jgi:DNA repair protein RadA/Sms
VSLSSSKSASKSRFVCVECGASAVKWAGKCVVCGEWNTLVEERIGTGILPLSSAQPPVPITQVSTADSVPIPTGIDEFDRVLAGGLTPGSVTLLGGEPGVGKSTLLLQLLQQPAAKGTTVLYVSAEESAQQIRRRAERLGTLHPSLLISAETNLAHIITNITSCAPAVVVVDSIQSVYDPELGSAPGSVGQVRQCAHLLVSVAKARSIAVVLVGHVTKEGSLAGPRVLEHVVDTVLSLEGDRHHSLRMLRAVKHRFGSTQELGLFAMASNGLETVTDPSEMFLADRSTGAAGSVIVPTMDGHRPLLVEIQALLANGKAAMPRRSTTGVDPSRVGMILAVIERRLGIEVLPLDTYALAVGGAKVVEPAADLGLALAILSSLGGKLIPPEFVICGEVGLAGEVRSVSGIERRLSEAERLGFEAAIVPKSTPKRPGPLQLIPVATLGEAVQKLRLTG